MLMFGCSQAVAAKAIVPTTSVMTRRFKSATGPPRHSHRILSCVSYRVLRSIWGELLIPLRGRHGGLVSRSGQGGWRAGSTGVRPTDCRMPGAGFKR